MKKHWLLVLPAVGLLILSACNLPASATPEPDLPPDPPKATLEPVESFFGPETFTLSLPEGWGVAGPENLSMEGKAYALFRLGPDPSSSGGPGTSLVIIADPGIWTPEALVQAQCSTCPLNPFDAVSIDGQPALRTQVGGGGVPFLITWHFLEHKGKLIAIAIHDPETLEPLDDVIQSIMLR